MEATLHLMCGMAGSGKTTLAKAMEKSGVVRFCPDEWILKLIKDKNDFSENERLRGLVEELQLCSAQRLLQLGVDVVLENGFWGRGERERYRDVARSLGAKVKLHYLDVSRDELWSRIQSRNNNLGQESFRISEESLDSWLACFQKPDEIELATYD